jgi:transaldolase
LIYKAALLPQYENLVQNAIDYAAGHSGTFEEKLDLAMDKLAVNFGAEITKIVPGYVSTEVDARLSFDTQATLTRARRIINMYQEVGIDKSRILIKVAPPSVLTVTHPPLLFTFLFLSFRSPPPTRASELVRFLKKKEFIAI